MKADERAIKQILLNLLSNAIKFTKEGGKIFVEGQLQKKGQFDLYVKDTGIGIPKSKGKILFEPFSQLENVLTKSHPGTGLGLALVKKIMQMHQGSVKLESVVDKGTVIHVIFPSERVIEIED